MIAQMTGASATTDTADRWAVTGTDLGVMWDNGSGEVLTALGDTFGEWGGPGGGGGDWRSNALLRSVDSDLSDGMSFDSAVEDRPGHAGELIPSKKISGDEMTTIPTAGIAVGDRQYMAFMSVKEWGPAGQWWTNFSRIAYSDDNGETWSSTDGPTWTNTATASQWDDPDGPQHPFQMVAFEKRDGYVYMFGTPNGRLGAVHVARVEEGAMLDKSAWRYWDGSDWSAGDGTAAEAIVPPMNSELSVQFNEHTGKWLMVTLDGKADGTMLLRTADSPEGPWTEGEGIANSFDYPGLYGGYIHPWSSGSDLYIALSQWDPYNVFLIRVQLDEEGGLVNPNLLRDPSFERNATMTAPWGCNGNCGIDTNHAWSYAGSRQAWMRGTTGALDVHQPVDVSPNTDYVFSGFVVTGGVDAQGFFGVREVGPGAATLAVKEFTAVVPYERFEIEFNSGVSTRLEVFVGTVLNGDRWVQIDDLALVRSDPTGTTDPTDPTEPTDPMDPIEPVDPADPDPTDPGSPTDPDGPGSPDSAPDVGGDSGADALATTGSDAGALIAPIAIGFALIVAGSLALLLRRKRVS
ncbi:DUF4185 domain-containing protein [Microbacterium ginsengiterrae]